MKIDWNYNLEGCTETDNQENDVRVQVPFIGTYEMLDRLIDMEIEREEEYRESEHEEESDCNATFEMAAFLKDYVKNIAYAILKQTRFGLQSTKMNCGKCISEFVIQTIIPQM